LYIYINPTAMLSNACNQTHTALNIITERSKTSKKGKNSNVTQIEKNFWSLPNSCPWQTNTSVAECIIQSCQTQLVSRDRGKS